MGSLCWGESWRLRMSAKWLICKSFVTAELSVEPHHRAAAALFRQLRTLRSLGASGFTARQLGGYAQVDRRELGKVATRKLGYLFQYRQAH